MKKWAVPLAAIATVLATTSSAFADVEGIDVSSYQHPSGASIGWSKLPAQGVKWGVIKADEGTSYKNPYFARDYAAASSANMIRGAYHFAHPDPDRGDATAEARHFVSMVGTFRSANTLPPVLDIETSNGLSPSALISWTNEFLTETKRLTGRTPIIYTYGYFWQHAMGNSRAFTSYPLWLASYSSVKPAVVGGWSRYIMWQYTSSGRLSGISGRVDRNKFFGTSADLAKLANGGGTTPAPQPTQNNDPFGYATARRTANGVEVDGWALDPNTKSAVDVSVTGAGTSKRVTANTPDLYVSAHHPWYGPNHGFHVVLPAKAGATTVTVTAVNAGAGTSQSLLTKALTISTTPTGSITINRNLTGALASGWVVDPDSTAGVPVTLTVDGHAVSSATATAASSNAAAQMPGYGSAHGLSMAAALTPGSHKVCVTAKNLGAGAGIKELGCATLTKSTRPIGTLTAGATSAGFKVSGWTLDDTSINSLKVQATVDGHRVAAGTASLTATGIPGQYVRYGTKHGYTLAGTMPAGNHQVCVNVTPAGKSTPVTLDCANVWRSYPPIGATAFSLAGAKLSGWGWAVDPDAKTKAVTTRLTVDGKTVKTVTANRDSAQAAAKVAGAGRAHGYATSQYVFAGTHKFCASADNTGVGGAGNLGCVTKTVSPNPFGSVHFARKGHVVTVNGWVADPNTSAPSKVRIMLESKKYDVTANTSYHSANLGPLGAKHGFQALFDLDPGHRKFSVYAVNVGAGSTVKLATADYNIAK